MSHNAFSIMGLILGVAGIICGLLPMAAMVEPEREERSKLTRIAQAWLSKEQKPDRLGALVSLIVANAILGAAASGCGLIAIVRRESGGLEVYPCLLGAIALVLAAFYVSLAVKVILGVIVAIMFLWLTFRYLWNFIF